MLACISRKLEFHNTGLAQIFAWDFCMMILRTAGYAFSYDFDRFKGPPEALTAQSTIDLLLSNTWSSLRSSSPFRVGIIASMPLSSG